MAHEKLQPTYNFTEDKIQALKKIVPEAFEDGKINFETLRECLGDLIEDRDDERFGLIWPGKREARRLAAIPSKGTLVPVYGEGLKADGTPDGDFSNNSRNVFIEGENLEVLKILHKSYAGRIKMIYIDPPYNTGNDFIYDDDFTEPLQHYLRRTGQIDDEGRPLTTNKRSDGRFHSKWLSMMYSRLKLARELLREDGVIFVSINDSEVHNVKSILNEIFGEENFLASLVWNTEGNTDNQLEVKVNHEYILLYIKDNNYKNIAIGKVIDPNTPDSSNLKKGFADNNINKNNKANPPQTFTIPKGFQCTEEELFFQRDNVDEQFFSITKREKIISEEIIEKYNIRRLPVLLDDMIVKNGILQKPCRIYVGAANANKLNQFINNGIKVIYEGEDEIYFYLNRNGCVRYRRTREKARNILSVLRNLGTTEKNRTYLKGQDIYFDYPKPFELLKYLTSFGCQISNGIVLDFFAGSATITDAIYRLNEDGLERSFIAVQLPQEIKNDEVAYSKGFRTIAELSKKRIKAASKIPDSLPDRGFKVFRLQPDQLTREWSGNLNELFQEKRDWNKSDLLFELILTEGFPLDSIVKIEEAFDKNKVHSVNSDFHGHRLLICLDDDISEATIANLDFSGDEVFLCFDHAISDQNKLRLSDRGLIKTIS